MIAKEIVIAEDPTVGRQRPNVRGGGLGLDHEIESQNRPRGSVVVAGRENQSVNAAGIEAENVKEIETAKGTGTVTGTGIEKGW